MEHLTVSYGTAKKLEAVGFPQDTVFAWRKEGQADDLSIAYKYERPERPFVAAAPTAEEIADRFKGIGRLEIKISRHVNQPVSVWLTIEDLSGRLLYGSGDTMAEALASLFINLNSPEKENE